MLSLGLMSGTSADGVDAVLVEFFGSPHAPKWRLINFVSISYPAALRKIVIDVGQGKKLSSDEWLDLAEAITDFNVDAALKCDPAGQAQIVGCHGQTIVHRPPSKRNRGASWQLIKAPLMAKILNKRIIYDFRSADLAHGGHGAPLVPLLDDALFGRVVGWRALLNLGGIANLTLIPPKFGFQRHASVLGWDCGPGNSLLDLAVQRETNGELQFDLNGKIALSGSPSEEILEAWLKEPYFQIQPPKSTGREQFGLVDLQKRIQSIAYMSSKDLIATITAFTAAIVAQDLQRISSHRFIHPIELIVAGGGSQNPALMKELRSRCLGIRVRKSDDFGLPVQAREALAFALLAWWHIVKYPGNSPSVTGASKSVVLGVCANPS